MSKKKWIKGVLAGRIFITRSLLPYSERRLEWKTIINLTGKLNKKHVRLEDVFTKERFIFQPGVLLFSSGDIEPLAKRTVAVTYRFIFPANTTIGDKEIYERADFADLHLP